MPGVEEVVNHLLYRLPNHPITYNLALCLLPKKLPTTNGLLPPHEPLKAKRLYQFWRLPHRHQLCYCLAGNCAQFEAARTMASGQDDVLPAGRFAEDGIGVR